jgi:uncharacterized protein YjbI with pentapeptide repeats
MPIEASAPGEKAHSGADLRGTNLSQANLSGAHLERANLFKAVFDGADLAGAFFMRPSS